VILYIWTHAIDPNVQKVPQSIDWNATHQNALAEQIKNTSTNPYGVENFMCGISTGFPCLSQQAQTTIYIKDFAQFPGMDRLQNPFDRPATTGRQAIDLEPPVECSLVGGDGRHREHTGHLLR